MSDKCPIHEFDLPCPSCAMVALEAGATVVCAFCKKTFDADRNNGDEDFPICEECMVNEMSMGLYGDLVWED